MIEHARAILVLVLVGIVVSVVASVVSIRTAEQASDNADTIAVLARRDRARVALDLQAVHQADFRLCVREDLNRAELHFHQARDGAALGISGALAAIQQRLPILNCNPNLDGDAARVLAPREQTRYVRFYVRTKGVPPVVGRDGHVLNEPLSRRDYLAPYIAP